MENKRGFLLAETTLKIVIAVIAIGFLIYFLVSLYFASQDNDELEKARLSLDKLLEEIDQERLNVELFNPQDWVLLSWPYGEDYPTKCVVLGWESCLCLCEDPWINTAGNFLDNCEETQICSDNPKKLVVMVGENQLPIEIGSPSLKLEIDYTKREIRGIKK